MSSAAHVTGSKPIQALRLAIAISTTSSTAAQTQSPRQAAHNTVNNAAPHENPSRRKTAPWSSSCDTGSVCTV